MRLIDADALLKNMLNYAAPEMVWDRGDIEHKINEMPTVDAIPVEWLRKWPKDLREGAYIRDILRDWQKEQEAR